MSVSFSLFNIRSAMADRYPRPNGTQCAREGVAAGARKDSTGPGNLDGGHSIKLGGQRLGSRTGKGAPYPGQQSTGPPPTGPGAGHGGAGWEERRDGQTQRETPHPPCPRFRARGPTARLTEWSPAWRQEEGGGNDGTSRGCSAWGDSKRDGIHAAAPPPQGTLHAMYLFPEIQGPDHRRILLASHCKVGLVQQGLVPGGRSGAAGSRGNPGLASCFFTARGAIHIAHRQAAHRPGNIQPWIAGRGAGRVVPVIRIVALLRMGRGPSINGATRSMITQLALNRLAPTHPRLIPPVIPGDATPKAGHIRRGAECTWLESILTMRREPVRRVQATTCAIRIAVYRRPARFLSGLSTTRQLP